MHPPPRLLGRIEELEILRQLIANVRDGQSAVVVVRGEPGIGKTELLGALIAEASGFGWSTRPASSRRWSWPTPGCTSCALR